MSHWWKNVDKRWLGHNLLVWLHWVWLSSKYNLTTLSKVVFPNQNYSNTETNQPSSWNCLPSYSPPHPRPIVQIQTIFDFLPGLQRALWPQTHFWPTESAPWTLGVYIFFQEINCHLAVLSLQAPQALLRLPSEMGTDSQNKVGSWEYDQIPLNWKINSKGKSNL